MFGIETRNINTYKGFRPRFTGVLTSETSGRRWRLSLIPIDAAISGLDYPTDEIRWANSLVWNVGRGDEMRPSNTMGASCTVEAQDPGGALSRWIYGFEDAERIKLLVEELPSQGLKPALGRDASGAPRYIAWLGSLYPEASEAPYYPEVHTQTLRLTAYDQLGKLDKEEAIQSAVDDKGDRVPFPVYLDEAYSEILWALADLDIEIVQPVVPEGSHIAQLRQIHLSEGIKGDSVRDQMDLLMESFGTRLFQTFEGRWRIQHTPTWPEAFDPVDPSNLTDKEKRAQMLRRLLVPSLFGDQKIPITSPASGITIAPIIYPIAPAGDGELMHGRQRRAGKISIEREGRENFVRDRGLKDQYVTYTSTGQPVRKLRHFTTYDGPTGHVQVTGGDGTVRLTNWSGISQPVMRISPIQNGYARIRLWGRHGALAETGTSAYQNFSYNMKAKAALLLEADNGVFYAWRDYRHTDPTTGRTRRVRRWERTPGLWPSSPAQRHDFGIGRYVATWDRRHKYSVPLEDLPASGMLHIQAWSDEGYWFGLGDMALRIVDNRNNTLPSFKVVIGNDTDREHVEIDTIEGAEFSGAPVTWKDLDTQETFVDLVEWQALDAAELLGVDTSRLEGRMRKIIPPEATLLARDLKGEDAFYIPISITVEAAPFEATSGTWMQLPKREQRQVDSSFIQDVIDFFRGLF